MSGEITYDLLEESAWSRVIVGCVIAGITAAVLAVLWFFSSSMINHLSYRMSRRPGAAIERQTQASVLASTPSNIRVIALDGTSAKRSSAIWTAPPLDPLPSATQNEPASQQSDLPQPAAIISSSQQSTQADTKPWTPLQASFQSTVSDADPQPIAHPPLPRTRPHLTPIGTLTIPLPHPRPLLASDEPAVVAEEPDRYSIH